MPDRLPSDHDAVETRRVAVDGAGRTDRPKVELPDDLDVAEGDVVRLTLGGETYHARIDRSLDGTLVVRRAADNARLAREGDGENRLVEWVAGSDVRLGGSAHLDIVTPGYAYGLREPGTRVVYTATDAPDESLSAIARNLE